MHRFFDTKNMTDPKKVADKIRDLINYIEIKKEEELEAGEGRKIEEDTAAELDAKLREIAKLLAK